MEAPLLPPEGIPQPELDRFDVWVSEAKDPSLRKNGQKIVVEEHQIALNGVHLGMLHLETSGNGQITSIDGIDYGDEVEPVDLTQEQWRSLSFHLYAKGVTKARRVEWPDGQQVFLEAL